MANSTNEQVVNSRIGVFPEGWNVLKMGDIASVTKLAGFEFTDHITYKHDGEIIAIRALNLKKGKLDLSDIKRIDKSVSEGLKRSKLFKGDIVFSYVGTIGEVANIEENDKYHLAPNVAKIVVDRKYNSKFVTYYLTSRNAHKEIKRLLTTSSQPALSMGNIREIQIPIPSFAEQEKIASILSTWDKAIELKEKLIEQKKEQKKGLMQKLLTGEVRLPGFSNEWSKVYLGEVCSVTTGNKDTQNKVEDGKYPFFVRSQVVERINSYSFDGEAILTAGDGVGVGKVFHYINGKFDFHQRVYKLSNFNGIDGYFLYCYFSQNFMKQISKYNAKTSVDSVRMEMLTKMQIPLPEMEEQKKLGQLFKTLENEIELINKELETIKEQKQGLMQLLLTGKVRVKV